MEWDFSKIYVSSQAFLNDKKEVEKLVKTLSGYKGKLNNKKDIFEKAFKFLMPMDFLIAKFTGECVTDYSMASGTLIYCIITPCPTTMHATIICTRNLILAPSCFTSSTIPIVKPFLGSFSSRLLYTANI